MISSQMKNKTQNHQLDLNGWQDELNYLESKIAAEVSRVELFRIEFYRALKRWYNMNEIVTSFDPHQSSHNSIIDNFAGFSMLHNSNLLNNPHQNTQSTQGPTITIVYAILALSFVLERSILKEKRSFIFSAFRAFACIFSD